MLQSFDHSARREDIAVALSEDGGVMNLRVEKACCALGSNARAQPIAVETVRK